MTKRVTNAEIMELLRTVAERLAVIERRQDALENRVSAIEAKLGHHNRVLFGPENGYQATGMVDDFRDMVEEWQDLRRDLRRLIWAFVLAFVSGLVAWLLDVVKGGRYGLLPHGGGVLAAPWWGGQAYTWLELAIWCVGIMALIASILVLLRLLFVGSDKKEEEEEKEAPDE